MTVFLPTECDDTATSELRSRREDITQPNATFVVVVGRCDVVMRRKYIIYGGVREVVLAHSFFNLLLLINVIVSRKK